MCPPQLRGFVCAYQPAAPGSNPKQTIYAFFNFILLKLKLYMKLLLQREKDENKQKEAGIGLLKNQLLIAPSY